VSDVSLSCPKAPRSRLSDLSAEVHESVPSDLRRGWRALALWKVYGRLLSAPCMRFEPFDLLQRVVEGHDRASYDLSSSDMPPQRLEDVGPLPDFSLAESHVGGGPELREQLARMFGGHSEEYVVTAGASEADFAVCAALLEPNAPVLVETPTYQPLLAIPRGLSANVTPLVRREANGFLVDPDDLRTALPTGLRLLVLSNLHNPSGAALDRKAVQGIADLATQEGFHVLLDETFRELAFEAEPPTIGGMNERVIVTSSVTKFYGAGGLRIGWVRAADPVRAQIRAVLDYLSVTPAGASERIALGLLREKPRTVDRNRRLIREGRRIAAEWAAQTPRISYVEPVAHLCFPGVDTDTAALADVLLGDHSTFIAPGESFGLERHFRLNLGRGEDQLRGGLDRVTMALSRE